MRNILSLVVSALLCAVLVSCFDTAGDDSLGPGIDTTGTQNQPPPELGKAAPEFVLPAIDGKDLRLSKFRGKVVYLDFWASWCEPCLRALPDVKALWSDYRDQDFIIIGVSLDYTQTAWRNFVNANGLDWKQTYDDLRSSGGAVSVYRVRSIPQTFLIDKDGVLIGEGLGKSTLRSKIDEALAG